PVMTPPEPMAPATAAPAVSEPKPQPAAEPPAPPQPAPMPAPEPSAAVVAPQPPGAGVPSEAGSPPRSPPKPAPSPQPPPPPEPKTRSTREEQYRWKADDSFAAVSTQYYRTDKYALALQMYNQDYPLAGPAMRQNPPAVAPGQVVWVPPARILERDYGPHIGGLAPVATPTSRPAVEAGAPPPGLANSGVGNTAGQLYRVRAPRESVQGSARRTGLAAA